MWILWLHNLFHNLTTNYAWNNYALSNVTKLQKLAIRAMNIETRIWKYCYETHNRSFDIIHLHATYGGQRWAVVGGKLVTKFKNQEMAIGQAPKDYLRCLFRRTGTTNSWRWQQQQWSRPVMGLHVVFFGSLILNQLCLREREADLVR